MVLAAPVAREGVVARVVLVVPAVPAALAVVARAAGVTIFEAVVAPVAPVVLAVLAVLVARVALAVPAVLAGAVGSVPVGVETPPALSASRAVGRLEVENPSAPSVKSSTTWKLRHSAGCGCRGVPVRRSGSRAVRP